MNGLLKLTRAIDALNLKVGKGLFWLVFAAVIISAANALVRKTFSMSSNAFLEVQWYLFAAVFLLGAGHVMLLNEHVLIDHDGAHAVLAGVTDFTAGGFDPAHPDDWQLGSAGHLVDHPDR